MNQTAVKGVLAAILMVMAFLLAGALPSTILPSHQSTTTITPALGALAVQVLVQDQTGTLIPAQGDSVHVSQLALNGAQLAMQTNASGMAEVLLPPGLYLVSASEERFQITANVTVNSGEVSDLQISASRAAYASTFSDIQDVSGTGIVEPWEQIAVVIGPPYGYIFIGTATGTGNIVVNPQGPLPGPGVQVSAEPNFGDQVFIEPISCCQASSGMPTLGKEVPAMVISQGTRGGEYWLQLQPTRPFDALNASYIQVARYTPSYTVGYIVS